ncbi:MAG TPA: sugar ABC transporter permease, partial [Polyangia bacterium]|nr:sugar ABC transporter permease [Polyangia bacterium]
QWAGLTQYRALFASERWWLAARNLGLFALLFVGAALLVGLLLAIFLDQRIRAEGALRTIYLYPMALSFIVTGTAWKWLLNPGLGLEHVMQSLGWHGFHFDWLIDENKALYTIVLAAVWQSSGFAMALFLAGLRGIDDAILRAAMIDGASLPRIYWKIVIPSLRPVLFSTLIILSHIAIKCFDLVIALTNGGPGFATDVPATFMYTMAFSRGQIGLGAASATMMLATVAALVVPYLYSELRRPAS